MIEYLLDAVGDDMDLNERTNHGKGGTPLWLAEHTLHPDHPVIATLREHGAVAVAPSKKEDMDE